MNLFWNLAGYEVKKVMYRKRTMVVLCLVVFLSVISVLGTLLVKALYYDESGNEILVSGYEDEMIDRRYGEELSGRKVDADLIMEAVEAYRQVPIGEDVYYSSTHEYQSFARKYSPIYHIVRRTLGIDVKEFQNFTREQAEQFDEVRRSKREYVIENSNISENMRKYWWKCLEKSPATLTYEYLGGHYRFIAIMHSNAIMMAAAFAVLFSGIFSEEYTSGADNLILSSKHGKGLVIGAKLFAVFGISAALVILLSAICYAESIIIWGARGADASIVFLGSIFPYPLTVGQSALLYFLCIFAACMFFSAMTGMLSAFFKTPFNTVVIMAVILIVPMLVSVPGDAPIWMLNLENLLPANMMGFWGAMHDFQYEIFGLVIPPYVFLPVFSAAGCCVCAYLSYRIFKKHQIG
ncbi:MAG: ABC transporter permease [Lachnospiraceae bacterium]|nr:ABC transporter permease [Lachnospiraceae bacterium]